jgi:hypothetical protein
VKGREGIFYYHRHARNADIIDGACHCGYIRVEGDADPEKTTVCHCTDCQVGTGSAFRVNVPVPGATFRITGQPATYLKTTAESGNPAGVLSACSCSCRTRYRPNRSWSLWPTQRRIQASSHWHRPAPAARRIWLASCSSKWPGSAKCRLSVPIRRNLTSGHLWVVLNFWRFHPVPSINSRATLNPRRGEQIATSRRQFLGMLRWPQHSGVRDA